MTEGPGELMGPWEICERLNVSRSRFQQIAMRPSFPKPYQELRATKVWLKADVEAWIAEHRQPRPTDDDE
ncbi:helix-turn-helix transcriptional regulator [Micromonospora aurantiaca (nom. illeg.)]|uniref:helix-turn-helix transcriptional regulator n=1 Tax=Micromonospora aurantiaca (nom. illeg.) TaxID=47850 RepID=UPI0035AF73AB